MANRVEDTIKGRVNFMCSFIKETDIQDGTIAVARSLLAQFGHHHVLYRKYFEIKKSMNIRVVFISYQVLRVA